MKLKIRIKKNVVNFWETIQKSLFPNVLLQKVYYFPSEA